MKDEEAFELALQNMENVAEICYLHNNICVFSERNYKKEFESCRKGITELDANGELVRIPYSISGLDEGSCPIWENIFEKMYWDYRDGGYED